MTTSQVIRRERCLLVIAAAFLVVGVSALLIGNLPLAATGARSDGIRLAIAVLAFVACFGAAHAFLSRHLPDHDPLLLPTSALLTGWGIMLIGRLAINFLLRQTVWLILSTVVLVGIVRLSRRLRWLRRFRYTWLFGGLALLAATLVFGVNPSGYGPRLWFGVWGMYFQPSEPLKLLMIVYLASYLAERGGLIRSDGNQSEDKNVGHWRILPLAYVGPLLVMFGLATMLLVWQQDLGTAMLFFFTSLAMLYLATNRWGYVAAGLVLFLIAGLAGYQLSDKIALRVDGWLNPWPEAADRTFQIVQSLLAFGAGGVFGQGTGLGSPTYIPAVHTDFVFAAIGEEFGLAGTVAVVALYGVLLFRGFRIAARAEHPFERFLAAGLTAGWVIQAWVIMAGNAKLAPIAGVTLPFVSYGGSSLLTSFIALGLLLRISSRASEYRGRSTPSSQPTDGSLLRVALALSLALAILVALCGYWSVVRADDLRVRTDNPRRVLYEQRIVRGRILDRNGAVLADVAVADDDTVTRRYPVPEAAPAVGYASLRYGTGGIEAAFDAELRGEAGRSTWRAAWDDLLHSPPHGQDVQLTLDETLQVQAQHALENQGGAVVLLNATTGEILALASSPTFDPERLDEDWEMLREDPAAPLVNRTTQGLYQPGVALQTVIVAEALTREIVDLSTPISHATATIPVNGTLVGCNKFLSGPTALADAYAAACPAPVADLGERLGAAGLAQAIERWGLTIPPSPGIPAEAADWEAETITTTAALRSEAIGQGRLTVSPLHMALVAGTLANEGRMPVPQLARRVEDAEGGWRELLSAEEGRAVLSPDSAGILLANWPRCGGNVVGLWGAAVASEDRPPHAWFIGATLPAAGETSYAIAVLVEHAASPEAAVDIGAALMELTTSP